MKLMTFLSLMCAMCFTVKFFSAEQNDAFVGWLVASCLFFEKLVNDLSKK